MSDYLALVVKQSPPNFLDLIGLSQIYCKAWQMNSEKPGIGDRLKSIFSIALFVILVVGVGFLSINFILAISAKFSEN